MENAASDPGARAADGLGEKIVGVGVDDHRTAVGVEERRLA
jgi:hypothetical protein